MVINAFDSFKGEDINFYDEVLKDSQGTIGDIKMSDSLKHKLIDSLSDYETNPANTLKTERKLFVYGTLMKGFENFNKYLKGKIKEIKRGYTYGKLYHLSKDNYPALLDGKDKVWGEIITFYDDGQIMKEIDKAEEVFDKSPTYLREKRKVFYEDGKQEFIDMYIYKKNIDSKSHIYIESGDWKTFLSDKK
jgi:gamma-glutamylcyclotransferase (GGCT)/AIG2-like uncharacterized protein YtfP